MAESDSTLGTHLPESKILAKPYNFKKTSPSFSTKEPAVPSFLDKNLPATMENLHSQINYLLSLPLPKCERKRLLLNYWALEFQVEEIRLLLDKALGDPFSLDLLKQVELP